MRNSWKKALALCLGVCMGASALTGCGKNANAAPIVTFDGEKIDNNLFTFMFRYEEGQFDEIYGAILSSYYGASSAWGLDLMGMGTSYGESFKIEFQEKFENFLLAEKHAGDFGIALSDEENAKIAEVADDFLAKNDKDTLKSMCADKEVVVRALELYTIQKKVESAVEKDVDTEVSDEEAAQKNVSYICFTPLTGDLAEEETETLTEAEVENLTEADVTPVADEPETAALEEESEGKTKAEDGETESGTEGAASETEADLDLFMEEEETEDAELAAAKEKARAQAEEVLDYLKDSDEDFSEFMEGIEDVDAGITTATLTFGEDDSYPDSEIIKATKDAEDNTLIDHVVEGGNGYYYIVYVNLKFDEEATEQKKEDIISDRKDEAVEAKYTEWQEGVDFVVDDEAFSAITFDRLYTAPVRTEEESSTEAETEAEALTNATEAETEAET